MSDLLVTIVGYVVITVLSFIIAARVRKYLNARVAMYTHLLVIGLAIYYGVDLLLLQQPERNMTYFYLWIAVIVTQIVLMLIAMGKLKKVRRVNNKE